MTSAFKPMLASPADLDAVHYPIYASPKLDGIRAAVVGKKLLSRTLKEIPSRYISTMFSGPEYEGLDGELIVGDPTSPTCYRDTVSGVMADGKTPQFAWHVFDLWNIESSFHVRRQALSWHTLASLHANIRVVEHTLLKDREELDAYEGQQVALGYEGVMLADPNARYKFGRATTRGGELLKVKRFVDAEAVILDVVEEMFNGNEAETNELGRTKRSSAQAGKVGKGSMGALTVRDKVTGVEFNIGTGFTADERARFWKDDYRGRTLKYKSFPIGTKDKPRHPVYLGMRPEGA